MALIQINLTVPGALNFLAAPAAVLFLCMAYMLPTHGASVQDQGQIFGSDGEVTIVSQVHSQSITTGLAGQLTGIEIQIASFPDPEEYALLDFSLHLGGNPHAAHHFSLRNFQFSMRAKFYSRGMSARQTSFSTRAMFLPLK